MSCEHDKAELVLMLYGELDAAARPAAQQRVQECAGCRLELEELRQGAAALSAMPAVEAPEPVLQRIEGELRRQARRGPIARLARSQAPRWAAPLALAAALAAGAVTGLWPVLFPPSPAPVSTPAGTAALQTPALLEAPELLSWTGDLDRRLESIAEDLEAARPAAGSAWPELADSSRSRDLDEALEALEAQIARLRAAPTWSSGRADL
jgi:hypothetical protein